MTAIRLEDIFGRSRLEMETNRGVEVVREPSAPGERRRYTKRFLATPEGDFRAWTARESRILAHLRGRGVRCVPELIGFDSASEAMQTFDAGVTVDHCATLLRVRREARVLPHMFADCAHWWALAHHTLRALETLHLLQLVHLDVKADNICVPVLPAGCRPDVAGSTMGLQFARLALIDFAFALLPAEPLAEPIPLRPQPDYQYQSPRLLQALEAGIAGDLSPMKALDWRCDMYSLAAMLRLYLPPCTTSCDAWNSARHSRALALLAALGDAHDGDTDAVRPHQALIEMCEAELREPELVASLLQGFALAPTGAAGPDMTPSTPLTRIGTRGLTIERSAPISATPSVVRHRRQIEAHRAAIRAAGLASIGRAAPDATPNLASPIRTAAAPVDSCANEQKPAPSVARKRSHGAQPLATRTPRAAAKTSPAHRATRASAPIRRITRDASLAQRSVASPPPQQRPGGPSPLPNGPSQDVRPMQEKARIAPLSPHSPQHILRAHPVPAIIAVALVIALGIALYPRERRGELITSRSGDSTTAMNATSEPYTAPDRVAKANSGEMRDREPLRGAPNRPASRAGAELSVDAATVQRAANADPRELPHARASDTQHAELRAAPHAGARDTPQIEVQHSPSAELRNTPSADSRSTPSADSRNAPRAELRDPPRADLPNNVPVPERNAIAKSSRQPPPVSSPQPSDTRTASAAGSPPPPLQRSLAASTSPADRHVPSAIIDYDSRAAEPQVPSPGRSVPSRSDEGTTTMVRIPGLEDVAARTEGDVARVLALAAAPGPGNEDRIVQVARSMRPVLGVPHMPTESPPLARQLNAEARAAWERQDINRALTLQQRAFRANPNDAEVTGNLAFYYLKTRPAQPALARRLALYALAARGQAFPAGRVEDWGTLAVASSLEGREADAVKAMYVMLTVSRNPERACRAAQLAVAQYGEPMKVPARAMLSRVRARGVIPDAPSCR